MILARALMEMKRCQKTSDLLIPKAPFRRLVCEIIQDLQVNMKIQQTAVMALQEAAELTLVTELSSKYTNSLL
jgi:histone H3